MELDGRPRPEKPEKVGFAFAFLAGEIAESDRAEARNREERLVERSRSVDDADVRSDGAELCDKIVGSCIWLSVALGQTMKLDAASRAELLQALAERRPLRMGPRVHPADGRERREEAGPDARRPSRRSATEGRSVGAPPALPLREGAPAADSAPTPPLHARSGSRRIVQDEHHNLHLRELREPLEEREHLVGKRGRKDRHAETCSLRINELPRV